MHNVNISIDRQLNHHVTLLRAVYSYEVWGFERNQIIQKKSQTDCWFDKKYININVACKIVPASSNEYIFFSGYQSLMEKNQNYQIYFIQ